ncbi:eCIS core domain-containing protein [Ruegeria hyattellae]|uniref:eCIS core domain-containing protein n=1 Tax=Ruegeria hyattellae TaxID=3233337 RepID=UPI00355AFBC0
MTERARHNTRGRAEARPAARAERQARAAAQGQRLWHSGIDAGTRAAARVSGSGRPLTGTLRQEIGRRFGADLSGVRLHDDAMAQEIVRERGAHALTEGHHIYMGAGALQPETAEGRARLEHELLHVVQQKQAGGPAASLADEKTTQGGYGAEPPKVVYDVGVSKAVETAHILFEHDDIHIGDKALGNAVNALSNLKKPVIVELHGYTSMEGKRDYNLNLSAHRAARAKRELLPYLPDGSEVRLVAHGETEAFGNKRHLNRRVGVKVVAKGAKGQDGKTLPLNPRAAATDPQPNREGAEVAPEVGATVPPPVLFPRPGTPGFLPGFYRPHTDPSIGGPLRLNLPTVFPRCPFAPGTDEMDWVEIMRPLNGRGGQLSVDQTLALSHSWAATSCTYFGLLSPLLGNDLARTLTVKGTNMGLATAMDQSAYWEHPTAADRFDLELRRQGIETTFIPVSDILVGAYQFIWGE